MIAHGPKPPARAPSPAGRSRPNSDPDWGHWGRIRRLRRAASGSGVRPQTEGRTPLPGSPRGRLRRRAAARRPFRVRFEAVAAPELETDVEVAGASGAGPRPAGSLGPGASPDGRSESERTPPRERVQRAAATRPRGRRRPAGPESRRQAGRPSQGKAPGFGSGRRGESGPLSCPSQDPSHPRGSDGVDAVSGRRGLATDPARRDLKGRGAESRRRRAGRPERDPAAPTHATSFDTEG